jgi:hypothetical protein
MFNKKFYGTDLYLNKMTIYKYLCYTNMINLNCLSIQKQFKFVDKPLSIYLDVKTSKSFNLRLN